MLLGAVNARTNCHVTALELKILHFVTICILGPPSPARVREHPYRACAQDEHSIVIL